MESWTVVDDRFAVVEAADAFLAHLTAIERSPGTVRAYAFDLRDYFEFLGAHEIDWRTVRLEHLGRFVGWLRLPPAMRARSVTSLSTIEARCSTPTINRKLAAVGSFYKFHHRHGVDCGELLSTMKAGGVRGAWRPFLAHLGSAGDQHRRTIKLKTRRRLPRALPEESVQLIVDACDRLRDRFLIELLAGTGMRTGEALGAASRGYRRRRNIDSNPGPPQQQWRAGQERPTRHSGRSIVDPAIHRLSRRRIQRAGL